MKTLGDVVQAHVLMVVAYWGGVIDYSFQRYWFLVFICAFIVATLAITVLLGDDE